AARLGTTTEFAARRVPADPVRGCGGAQTDVTSTWRDGVSVPASQFSPGGILIRIPRDPTVPALLAGRDLANPFEVGDTNDRAHVIERARSTVHVDVTDPSRTACFSQDVPEVGAKIQRLTWNSLDAANFDH